MMHRPRHAATARSFDAPLEGMVEADETLVGGREKDKHASKRSGDTEGGKGGAVVLGMLERGGELRAMHVDGPKARNVRGIIAEHVEPGSHVMTDEHPSFAGPQGRHGRHTVDHSAGEYVRHCSAHTNGIEGAWPPPERQVHGTRHRVSPQHLARYAAETNDVAPQQARHGRGRAPERPDRRLRRPADLPGADRTTDRKKPTAPPPFPEMPLDEALARLIQTGPEEFADACSEVRQKEEGVERYVREREASIRRGARRASKRFRL